jgi:hypothetical protein
MLMESMKVLRSRWKQGGGFRFSEKRKKGARVLFSSRNAIAPHGAGL